ncbi:hypothetical protein L211DRAFT_475670 [Terfezia boudieri ATCC MYA-4762]|uniref:Uncharacterized protein n=1 Tax=Terfezia boudieri ATCC MYA-4762 TaxID=1051890 RepID=A0A3N4M552_9PEZI|nr:hypothetical protein L211DRAFT_475670 [Terfezia boudieri ATCC MYA-4762]
MFYSLTSKPSRFGASSLNFLLCVGIKAMSYQYRVEVLTFVYVRLYRMYLTTVPCMLYKYLDVDELADCSLHTSNRPVLRSPLVS